MTPAPQVIHKSPETLSEWFQIKHDLTKPDADQNAAKMKSFFAAAMKPTKENGTNQNRQ